MVWDLFFNVILSACLWGGFLNVIQKTGFMNYFSFLLKPLFHLIYEMCIRDSHEMIEQVWKEEPAELTQKRHDFFVKGAELYIHQYGIIKSSVNP